MLNSSSPADFCHHHHPISSSDHLDLDQRFRYLRQLLLDKNGGGEQFKIMENPRTNIELLLAEWAETKFEMFRGKDGEEEQWPEKEKTPTTKHDQNGTTILAKHILDKFNMAPATPPPSLGMAPCQIQPHQSDSPTLSSRPSSSSSINAAGTTDISSSSQSDPGECVVCGALASGLHYMVWSCNSCKTFFRRALMENRKYSCYKDGNCPIDARTRCTCRRCRFDKCLRVGMKFTEINIARKRKVHVELDVGDEHIQEAEDPLVRELLAKERQFRVFLTSARTPIHAELGAEATRSAESIFGQPIEQFQQTKQIGPENATNFWEWRTRILSIIVEWMKSFREFTLLAPAERHKLLVHSAFSLLVFSEAYHTPERYADRLVFPDGSQLTRNIPRDSAEGAWCPSGLNRAMVSVINKVLVPIRKIQLTEEEYVLLQALLFFDPECMSLEERSQEIVWEKREQVMASLRNYLAKKGNNAEGGAQGPVESARRQAQLLLRIPGIQKVAEFKRRFILQNDPFFVSQKHSLQVAIAQQYALVSFF